MLLKPKSTCDFGVRSFTCQRDLHRPARDNNDIDEGEVVRDRHQRSHFTAKSDNIRRRKRYRLVEDDGKLCDRSTRLIVK